jgi:hypothetical protein
LRFLPEQIEQWDVARLKPYARNPRLHSEDQVAKVAASIASYGWTVPLLVTEDGEVIAGHGRLLAALCRCPDYADVGLQAFEYSQVCCVGVGIILGAENW